MKDKIKVLSAAAVLAGALFVGTSAEAQTMFRPIAVVNDAAITGYDLAQRTQILAALGFSTGSPESLRNAALDQLVDDRLKVQAGKELGLSASPEQIELAISEFARRSDLSAAEFRAVLSAQGVSGMAIEDLAAAEVVWSQVIRTRYAGRVVPGEAEIDAELNDLSSGAGFEYRLLEIGLPLTADGRSEAETRALAEELFVALNQGGNFEQAVARFSRAPSAGRGGDVGWVATQRMPPAVLENVAGLEVGQVSRPISVPGGLSILKVVERRGRQANTQIDAETRERVRDRLIQRKSNRLAEGLLQELRRDALIEVR